jgi:hypothetical protein
MSLERARRSSLSVKARCPCETTYRRRVKCFFCIIMNPIDLDSQVHVFIFGMCEGMTRYRLTRAELATLEAAFTLALHEEYTVASSNARVLTPGRPEPLEIDAIAAESTSRFPSTSRGSRFKSNNRQMTCYRCRKPGHRAAVCRAPASVLATTEVVGDADDNSPAAHPKNGRDQ